MQALRFCLAAFSHPEYSYYIRLTFVSSLQVLSAFSFVMIRVNAQESISLESTAAVKVKGILDLDDDSFVNIFRFLSPIDVLNAECVNKR